MTHISSHSPSRNLLLKDTFDSLDTLLAWDLGHLTNPNSDHTSSQKLSPDWQLLSLGNFLAGNLGHFNNPNLFTHPLRNALLKNIFDLLDTFLAWDLGHFVRNSLFWLLRHLSGLRSWALEEPQSVHTFFQKFALKGQLDCLHTVLAWDPGHFNNPDLFTHPFRNSFLTDNFEWHDTVLA